MPKQSPQPAFLDTARAFYAEAFERKKKRDLARSIAEWSEMTRTSSPSPSPTCCT